MFSGPTLLIFLVNNETEIDMQAELELKTKGSHSEDLPQPFPIRLFIKRPTVKAFKLYTKQLRKLCYPPLVFYL